MILVSRLNDTQLLINPDLIEFIEETPDTVISMKSGRKMVVSTSADEIVERIIAFRRRIYTDLPQLALPKTGDE